MGAGELLPQRRPLQGQSLGNTHYPSGSATHARAIAAAKAKREKAEAVRQRTQDNAPAMLEALRALLEWKALDGMDAWERARALVKEIEGEDGA